VLLSKSDEVLARDNHQAEVRPRRAALLASGARRLPAGGPVRLPDPFVSRPPCLMRLAPSFARLATQNATRSPRRTGLICV